MPGETRAFDTGASSTASPLVGRAFVAVRTHERSFVVDLPVGDALLVGPAPRALVPTGAPTRQGRVRWDGRALLLEELPGGPEVFVAGKRVESAVELKPGDEIRIGDVQLVVGITSPQLGPSRRALTHQEFRERLAEELARAARGGRPTSLVMVRAAPGRGGALLAAALDAFRAGDVVATYAPDELELLLPDTPGPRALGVIGRILRQAGDGDAVVACAAAPVDADHPERLMRSARDALRHAGGIPPRHVHADDEPSLRDPASRQVAARLAEAFENVTPILLRGEPSSGKVAFARHAHRHHGGPLVVLDCGRVPSLSAALADARHGTLVLDEIGELPRDAQSSWLVELGDAHDTRIVATSHRDLRALAARDAFAPDLAAWLTQHPAIDVPPLRQRPDDIVPLAMHFAAADRPSAPVPFSTGALARLRSYSWPGNVLELRNAIERAVLLAHSSELLAEHLPGEPLSVVAADGRLREQVDSVERDTIIKALADANHNQTHAAKRLGLSRRALIYKLEKYGLKSPPGAQRRRTPEEG